MRRRTPTTCRRCGRQWESYREAHCAACHHHFSGVGAFDRHFSTAGVCGDPAERGLNSSEPFYGVVWTSGSGHVPTPPRRPAVA